MSSVCPFEEPITCLNTRGKLNCPKDCSKGSVGKFPHSAGKS